MSESAGISRRKVLRGSAVAGVGVPWLAACGGDDDGGDAEPAATGTVLAKTSEVPVGGGVILRDDEIVVTQPEQGSFKAFSAICTHQGCVVASVSDTINCTCHGSAFSISDGSVKKGPATSALEQRRVTVEGDQVKAG